MIKTAPDARPWVEKYRPRKIAEVSQQVEAKRLLSRIIETGNMPHLLFFGPPGSGKTSAALALVKELFGREDAKTRLLELNASDERGIRVVREKIKKYTRTNTPKGKINPETGRREDAKTRLLELNASDERGIRVVREKIKKYTRTNTPKGKINPETGREMPPWKIVILDEADMMTPDAQAALRRIMEAFARNTRFIIICNYIHKIIDPLFSRCSPHRFEPVSPDAQMERLQMICKAENLNVEEAAIHRLMNLTNGDLRRAVNLLQSAAGIHQNITEDAILEVAVMVAEVVKTDSLSDLQKATILHELGATEFAVLQGANSLLQLLSACLKIQAVVLQQP
ncbi:replication factor C small subunit, putative [Eimeria mitis]|uniref:Replication factor C small subunit, putative n=1 Tax=Eimeria mitis TaxID=44415 RepID=U6KC92_9EIME|nr:replication factor C small subunit, putative [Eimeria mitis]CDJ35574.1 replication factor C small subunit, putative [Eimeria mitis]